MAMALWYISLHLDGIPRMEHLLRKAQAMLGEVIGVARMPCLAKKVILTCFNHIRQWEGWHPIYEMENHPNVWNHQPVEIWIISTIFGPHTPKSFEHIKVFTYAHLLVTCRKVMKHCQLVQTSDRDLRLSFSWDFFRICFKVNKKNITSKEEASTDGSWVTCSSINHTSKKRHEKVGYLTIWCD